MKQGCLQFLYSLILLTFFCSNALGAPKCADSLKSFLSGPKAQLSPSGADQISLKIFRPKGSMLRNLVDDGSLKLKYIVDPENRVHFVKEAFSFNSERLMVVSHTNEKGELIQIPVKEAGRIEYNKEKQLFKFVPEFQPIDLAEEEIALIRKSGQESGEVIEHSSEGVAKARMMDCQKIYESQRSGKSFIWDQFLTSNALLALSIATHKPERFTDSENFDMLITDFVTTNEHTAIRSFTGRYMMLNGVGYSKRMASRVGVGLASTQIQGWTSQFIVQEKDGQSSAQRAEKITQFNRLWMFPSLVKSDALDKFVLRNLPEISYDLCLKGSPFRIFASPKMIRFAEGWLSSTIYFTLRDKFTGESSHHSPAIVPATVAPSASPSGSN